MEIEDLFECDDVVVDIMSRVEPQATIGLKAVDDNIAAEFREDLLHWIEYEKTESPRAPGLHCSSLWKTCPRVPLLEKKYAEFLAADHKTAGQCMTFDEGHALHDLIQNTYLGPFGRLWGDWKCVSCQKVVHAGVMPQTCPVCSIPWRDEHDGSKNIIYVETFVADAAMDYCGHCDGIVLTRAENKVVFEFKTISKSGYDGLKGPKHEHIVQVHAYMNALRIRDAIIVYWDKASQCDWNKLPDGRWKSSNPHLKVFHVKWDDALWLTMTKRINDYHRAEKKARELPVIEIDNINEYPRICTHKKCAMAAECGVRDICFAI